MMSIAEAVDTLRTAGLQETADMRSAECSPMMMLSAAIGAAREQGLPVPGDLVITLTEMVKKAIPRDRWKAQLLDDLAVISAGPLAS